MKAITAMAGAAGAGIFGLLFALAIYVGLGWLLASGVTSGVKAATRSCGTRYGIESYWVRGDLFCPEKK